MSGCAVWADWAAACRLRPAEPGSTVSQLHDAGPAPIAPLSAPPRRRTPARPAHAPEQTPPWNYSSSTPRARAEARARGVVAKPPSNSLLQGAQADQAAGRGCSRREAWRRASRRASSCTTLAGRGCGLGLTASCTRWRCISAPFLRVVGHRLVKNGRLKPVRISDVIGNEKGDPLGRPRLGQDAARGLARKPSREGHRGGIRRAGEDRDEVDGLPHRRGSIDERSDVRKGEFATRRE